MAPADYVILFVCLASAAVGVWRGFTKEALSLLTWLAAIWLAWRFSWLVEPLVGRWVEAPSAGVWIARAIVFLLVLIAGAVIAWLVRELVRHTGLSGVDRLLGGVFGFARGALVVGLAVLGLQLTGLDQDPWWQQARLKLYGDRIAAGIRYYAELGGRYLQERTAFEPV
ncbi:MAG TPA: CvpA family protein [Gammaproteobacteria bacterium]